MARRGENIRKRKDGRWEGRYTQYTDGGKRIKSIYGKTYKEVRKKLITIKNTESYTSINIEETAAAKDGQALTIAELAALWLGEVSKSRKYSTYIKYKNITKKYIEPFMGSFSIYDIQSNTLAQLLSKRMSESIQKSICCVFNQMMSYANQHYGIKMVQFNKKKSMQKNDTVRIFNESEQKALLRFLYRDMDESKLGILLCLTTGLRLGEICALRWSDIDMESGILHVKRSVQRISFPNGEKKTKLLESNPKTACSKRQIPLSEHLKTILIQLRKDEKYVLNKNCPMEPRTYQKRFHAYLQKAGIEDTNFHTLRHTFATNCILAGADVKSVSEILGHSNVTITLNRYVHPSMDMKRAHLDALNSIYGQYLGQVS